MPFVILLRFSKYTKIRMDSIVLLPQRDIRSNVIGAYLFPSSFNTPCALFFIHSPASQATPQKSLSPSRFRFQTRYFLPPVQQYFYT
jgi:hypothetical protein